MSNELRYVKSNGRLTLPNQESAMKTLADELKAEAEALRRRFVHHTRPKGPLSLKEAIELSKHMQPRQDDREDQA